jgi:hypothetical protein
MAAQPRAHAAGRRFPVTLQGAALPGPRGMSHRLKRVEIRLIASLESSSACHGSLRLLIDINIIFTGKSVQNLSSPLCN